PYRFGRVAVGAVRSNRSSRTGSLNVTFQVAPISAFVLIFRGVCGGTPLTGALIAQAVLGCFGDVHSYRTDTSVSPSEQVYRAGTFGRATLPPDRGGPQAVQPTFPSLYSRDRTVLSGGRRSPTPLTETLTRSGARAAGRSRRPCGPAGSS